MIKDKIKKLKKKKEPFIIIKYGIVSLGYFGCEYELVTISNGKLNFKTLDHREAREAIRYFELPVLLKADTHNMIWGDDRFKDLYKEKKLEIQ